MQLDPKQIEKINQWIEVLKSKNYTPITKVESEQYQKMIQKSETEQVFERYKELLLKCNELTETEIVELHEIYASCEDNHELGELILDYDSDFETDDMELEKQDAYSLSDIELFERIDALEFADDFWNDSTNI